MLSGSDMTAQVVFFVALLHIQERFDRSPFFKSQRELCVPREVELILKVGDGLAN